MAFKISNSETEKLLEMDELAGAKHFNLHKVQCDTVIRDANVSLQNN